MEDLNQTEDNTPTATIVMGDDDEAEKAVTEVLSSEGTVEEDMDDDEMTIIVLEQSSDDAADTWDRNSPEAVERRRYVLLRELRRVQRASFVHFLILCLIPTALLCIVISTIIGDDEDCESMATTCFKEPRTFMNAFTSRCICDTITVSTDP